MMVAMTICNKYFKKYRIMSECKGIISSSKDIKKSTSKKNYARFHRKKSFSLKKREESRVVQFLQEDANNRLCPGKKDHKNN